MEVGVENIFGLNFWGDSLHIVLTVPTPFKPHMTGLLFPQLIVLIEIHLITILGSDFLGR